MKYIKVYYRLFLLSIKYLLSAINLDVKYNFAATMQIVEEYMIYIFEKDTSICNITS